MKPQLILKREDFNLIDEIVRDTPTECSWLGIGPKYGKLRVKRIVVPDQENTAVNSHITDEAFIRVMLQLKKDERILWWGHSHASMKCFFSGTDSGTWNRFVRGDMDGSLPFLATVHNRETGGRPGYARFHAAGFDIELDPERTLQISKSRRARRLKKNLRCPKPLALTSHTFGTSANRYGLPPLRKTASSSSDSEASEAPLAWGFSELGFHS
jgi:hypothetical protein